MKKMILLLSVVFALFAQAEPLPVKSFFQNPSFSGFRISPDGRYVAGKTIYNGFLNIVVFDLEKREPRVLTGQEMDVDNFYWVNSERIFYSINQGEATFDAQRSAGSIFAVDVDGKNHRPILKSMYERKFTPGEKHRGHISVISVLPDDDKYVLVANHSRRRGYPDLYKMNVNNGGLTKISNNPGYITNYYVDVDGTILGGLSWEDRKDPTTAAIYRRDLQSGEWSKEMQVETIYDVPEFLGVLAGGDSFLFSKDGEDGYKSLYKITFDDGYWEKQVLKDDVYDIKDSFALRDIKSEKIIGVRYDRDKPVNHFFDHTYEVLYSMINDAIPNGSNYVYDFDDSGSKLLIKSISDRRSPQYFILDLKKGSMESLGEMFPNLADVYMPEQRPIQFQARDGHTVHGYIYLPEGYEKGSPVPMIVNPHGGPWGRDVWGVKWWFDLEAIYFVNRGFAVLKVDFRASTGYGKHHLEASYKNWDVSMHDIWDGTQWAIDQGYADKDNVGIAGASFGGTATMLSLVHRPDMFKFGINFFGVVDVPEHIKTYYQWKRDNAGDYWKEKVGDPSIEEDRVKLHRWSAIEHLDNLEAPLFLYHGLVDVQVDIEQTRDLVGRLKSIGKKENQDFWVEWDTDEGHGAFNPDKRIKLYQRIDEFLKPFAPAYK